MLPSTGPGTYNYSDLATEVRKNAVNSRTRKGGFGTTAVRELPLRKKNEEFLPGPAQYVVKINRVQEPKIKQAVFKSTTNRLQIEKTGNLYAPPPGSYEVANSFDKTQGKQMQCLLFELVDTVNQKLRAKIHNTLYVYLPETFKFQCLIYFEPGRRSN